MDDLNYTQVLAAYLDACRASTETALERWRMMAVLIENDQQRSDIGAALREFSIHSLKLTEATANYLRQCLGSGTALRISVELVKQASFAVSAAQNLLELVMGKGKKAIKWTSEANLADKILLSGEFSSLFSISSFIYGAYLRGFDEQQN